MSNFQTLDTPPKRGDLVWTEVSIANPTRFISLMAMAEVVDVNTRIVVRLVASDNTLLYLDLNQLYTKNVRGPLE